LTSGECPPLSSSVPIKPFRPQSLRPCLGVRIFQGGENTYKERGSAIRPDRKARNPDRMPPSETEKKDAEGRGEQREADFIGIFFSLDLFLGMQGKGNVH